MSVFAPNVLAGRHAFVTGGTSGINLGIAERLLRAGAKVAILGRNPEKASAAAEGLRAVAAQAGLDGAQVMSLTADVRDFAALDAAIRQAVAAFGPIDVLVNGAAGNFPAPAVAMSANGFKAVVDIDLLGTFNACRAAFEHLTKPGASVINISATQAFTPAALQAHVCAAKAGVDMVTRVLAIEWGPAGVRVNSIAPGPVDGTEGMRRLAPTPDARAKVTNLIPLQRFADVAEIAEVALFLSTPAASYVTGSVLVADGGQSLNGYGGMLG